MEKCLFIDDDTIQRKLIQLYLSEYPIELITAGTIEEGLKLARQLVPDYIIADYQLPDGTCHELLKAVKENDKLQSTKIVIVTSSLDDKLKTICLEEGAAGFLIKPIMKRKLFQLMGIADER